MGQNCRTSAISAVPISSGHLESLACHVVIIRLGPVGQVVNAIVQGCSVVCVD